MDIALNNWIAFVIASTILLAMPGLTVSLIANQILHYGKPAIPYTISGIVTGDSVALLASLAGVGAILATSAMAFTILKIIGACYLMWLGLRYFFTSNDHDTTPNPQSPPAQKSRVHHLFWQPFTASILHPKSYLFFATFLPLFIDPNRPAVAQFLLLGLTFISLSLIITCLWALIVLNLKAITVHPKTYRLTQYITGTTLVLFGAFGLLAKRAG